MRKQQLSEYETNARDILASLGATMETKFSRRGRPDWEGPPSREEQNAYSVTLSRGGRSHTFEFWTSVADSNRKPRFSGVTGKTTEPAYAPPGVYDVLACVQKNDPGSFEEFCADFGMDTDSRKALATWEAVHREFAGIRKVFGADGMEAIADIC